MEKDRVLNGIHIGEHGFHPDKIIDEIKTRCIDQGYNYACLRPKGKIFDQDYFIEWARYLTNNQIYFSFLYLAQFPPDGMESMMLSGNS